MKTFTIEWNAVITLEDPSRPGREALRELAALHGLKIDLGIATIAASENTSLREMPDSAEAFKARLAALGLEDLTMVLTLGVQDLTYWDLCRWGDKKSLELPNTLWPLIKPTTSIPKEYLDFLKDNGLPLDTELNSPHLAKWRNKWCDVYALEAHIAARRDVFVSGDVKNFRGSRRDRLLELGVGQICGYDEALEIARHG